MSEISDIAPTKQNRVRDLVSAAGVNVSDWGNFVRGKKYAASNPNYCYEWSFVEPNKVVVLNLWFENTSKENGAILQILNLREIAQRYKDISKTQRAKRATDTDLAVQTAVKEKLPVRVI